MGCFRLVIRVGGTRRLATGVPEEWSYSLGNKMDRTRLTGPLTQFGFQIAAIRGGGLHDQSRDRRRVRCANRALRGQRALSVRQEVGVIQPVKVRSK